MSEERNITVQWQRLKSSNIGFTLIDGTLYPNPYPDEIWEDIPETEVYNHRIVRVKTTITNKPEDN